MNPARGPGVDERWPLSPLDRFGQRWPRFNSSIESYRGMTLPAKPFGGSYRRPGRSLPRLDRGSRRVGLNWSSEASEPASSTQSAVRPGGVGLSDVRAMGGG